MGWHWWCMGGKVWTIGGNDRGWVAIESPPVNTVSHISEYKAISNATSPSNATTISTTPRYHWGAQTPLSQIQPQLTNNTTTNVILQSLDTTVKHHRDTIQPHNIYTIKIIIWSRNSGTTTATLLPHDLHHHHIQTLSTTKTLPPITTTTEHNHSTSKIIIPSQHCHQHCTITVHGSPIVLAGPRFRTSRLPRFVFHKQQTAEPHATLPPLNVSCLADPKQKHQVCQTERIFVYVSTNRYVKIIRSRNC